MIDAYAIVLLPGTSLIIPVAVHHLARMTGANGIGVACIFKLHEFSAAFWPGEGVALPSWRIIAIDVLRNDVEVTGKNNRHLACQKLCGTGTQPCHPGNLVVKFRAGGRVAIGKIDGGNAHAANRRLHIARLFILVIAGKAAQRVLDRQTRGDGDTIVALLPMKDDIPPDLAIEVCGKVHILRLGFLNQQNITAVGTKIVQDMVLARLGGIHVPAGDAHRSDGERCAATAGRGGVRIADGKIGSHQVLDVIELGIVDKFERDFINHNLDIMADEAEVILGTVRVDAEFILKPRTTAAIHCHAEKAALRLVFQHHGDAFGRRFTQRELPTCRQGCGGTGVDGADLVTHAVNMTACRPQIKPTG